MVLFFGELLADMITEEKLDNALRFELHVGGSPGNIAGYLSQFGVKTYVLSRVGSEPIGQRILEQLKNLNVDTQHLQIDKSNPTTLVFVTKSKESPDFFVVRGADKYIEIDENELTSLLTKIKFLHVSCWMLTDNALVEKTFKLLKKAKENGIKISFDPNCRDKIFCNKKIDITVVKEVLELTDYSKPSVDDFQAIFGYFNSVQDSINKFHTLGAKNVILTAGKEGAFVSDGNRIEHLLPTASQVVDTTGAGDGFWAGTYYGLVNGLDIFSSAKIGNKVAGYIVQRIGADVIFEKDFIQNLL